MFCGALTGRMKPKQIVYCRIMTMPTTLSGVCSAAPWRTEMQIGIIADESAVALAKPKWMTMRNSARMAMMKKPVASKRWKFVTISFAIQAPAFVERMAEPRLMPTPKSMSVPQPMRCCASFHVMMPMLGSIMSVMATMVVDDVSKGCTFFSVAQKNSRMHERIRSFFSSPFMGPRARSSFAIFSLPPSISFISGGIIFSRTK